MKTNYPLKALLTIAEAFINTQTGNYITWEPTVSLIEGVKNYTFFEDGEVIQVLQDTDEVIHTEDNEFILYEDETDGKCTFIRPVLVVDVAQFILNHSEDTNYLSEAKLIKRKAYFLATGRNTQQ